MTLKIIQTLILLFAVTSICYAQTTQELKYKLFNQTTSNNKSKSIDSTEKDKQETIDWILGKLNKYCLGIERQKYCELEALKGLSAEDIFGQTNWTDKYNVRFFTEYLKPQFFIDTTTWNLVISYKVKVDYALDYYRGSPINYNLTKNENYDTKSNYFSNVIYIPISHLKYISGNNFSEMENPYVDYIVYFRNELNKKYSISLDNDNRNWLNSFYGYISVLTFRTDLSLITKTINNVDDSKNLNSISVRFNFSEDYDLVNRLQNAFNHLKDNYCKKQPKEKF